MLDPIITDLRYVKKIKDSPAVAVPTSWVERSICEFCAARPFCNIANVLGEDATTQCATSILPLTFRDTTGLDTPPGEEFSTVRLGTAWYFRLMQNIGGVVAMYKVFKGGRKFLGYAKVKDVSRGLRSVAISLGSKNHLVRHLPDGAEKQTILHATLKKYYGRFDPHGDRHYSWITLERLDYDESKRLETSWPTDTFRKNRGYLAP